LLSASPHPLLSRVYETLSKRGTLMRTLLTLQHESTSNKRSCLPKHGCERTESVAASADVNRRSFISTVFLRSTIDQAPNWATDSIAGDACGSLGMSWTLSIFAVLPHSMRHNTVEAGAASRQFDFVWSWLEQRDARPRVRALSGMIWQRTQIRRCTPRPAEPPPCLSRGR
jgi:hypothetical protein